MTYRSEDKDRIVQMVRGGVPLMHAARIVGVSRQAVFNWRKADASFDAALAGAQSECIGHSVSVIKAETDWKAHAWFLERRARQHFGRDSADAHAPVPEDEREVDESADDVTTEDAERVLRGGL